MRLLATLSMAIRALRRNLLRTLLTMLGIIIGVGAVIAMVSIGNGAKAQVEAQIASLGQNVIMILSGQVTRGGFSMGFGSAPTLTKGDYEALRNEAHSIQGVSPEVRSFVQIAAGNQNLNTQVFGVGEDYLEIRAWPLRSGSNFTETDVRNAAKVAVIGQTTATTLFGDSDPVGQVVRIKNAPFTIVGALAPKGMAMMGNDQDDIILVPYTSAMVRLTGATTFRSFLVQAAAGSGQLARTQEEIVELLRQRHRIGPDRDDDFMVRTQEEIAAMATSTSRIMTVLLGAIAGVSLLVGGIGIMNIMLVSVTERTREIGLRLAVGARSRDILWQFLIEAVVLSVAGGLLGIGLGVGGARAVSANFGWTTLVSAQSIVLAFAFSAAIGVFFGFYPARQASRLDPIEALHYE
ncbi:MAG TPA: ABC transporter permease [Candidatus Paceibacterota bacterium]|nr:ABC transporter permease [Verrucomicrobiota bacterium]HOX00961.1 ABC transporter permease [Verrucomicrobiota bacterium]HRZ43773.1 ABC transporter permease [Candidatus Paceibacterota bacterium]